MKKIEEIMKELKTQANPKNVQGMARFGINPKNTMGISIPILRKMAKKMGKSHELAQELWDSKIHEARILAGLIDEPGKVTNEQFEKWAKDFDSWDVCDQVCSNLFDRTDFAYEKALEYSGRKEEFVKRTGYALMACLAWHDKKAPDEKFEQFFARIVEGSTDERNFVRKAVNWALRQIGKRSRYLNKKAIDCARRIQNIDSKTAKWIANDALRELTSESVGKRLKM